MTLLHVAVRLGVLIPPHAWYFTPHLKIPFRFLYLSQPLLKATIHFTYFSNGTIHNLLPILLPPIPSDDRGFCLEPHLLSSEGLTHKLPVFEIIELYFSAS